MSADDAPTPGEMVTCPRCRLSFPPGAAEDAPPVTGTVTVAPPNAPVPPTPTVPAPNDVPARIDRLVIMHYLGEGAFGRVYLAHDPLLKREVALKVAKPEQLAGQKRVERFQREARAAANLLHPHIVAVFDSGQDGQHHYIASAFVPGRSLATVLDEKAAASKRLEVREAVTLVRKLAEALAYAHKQGVVHRDVKPGNVMLRDDGEPLLMDFGLAARSDETEKLSIAGQFMGTPEYTAPEQWRGEARAASDQYSLGCLLFEVLTGEKPFVGSSSEHYLMLHTQVASPSPRKYRPELPRDLENICLKCLEKELGRRYSDCQALADDLRRWLEGEPVTARRPGMPERLMRWSRRNPALAGLLGVTLLALVSVAILAAVALGKEQETRQEADKAKKARDFLVSIFRISEKDVQAGNITARQILDDAEKRIPLEFAEQPELRAELLAAIEDVNRTLGRNIPAAMILELHGTVRLRSASGVDRPVATQALLFPDDRLTLPAGAEVKLVFQSDLHQETLKPGSETTIGREGCEPADAVSRRDDGLMMTFVRLSKGTFYMGWDGDKKGVKTQIKEDFEIAVHDVTQGQWQAVMGNNPSWFSRKGNGKNNVLDVSDEELTLFPVENVSWEDAQAFIKKLNEREKDSGYLYRLPTEAEWEYACRGGAASEKECSYHFYFAKPMNDLSSEQANFNGNYPFGKAPRGKYLGRPTRVGAYPPNKLGLCDMHGNVWQWCDDFFRPAAESSQRTLSIRYVWEWGASLFSRRSTGGSPPASPGRVVQGGSWDDYGQYCRAAVRNGYVLSYRGFHLGFRLVRVPLR